MDQMTQLKEKVAVLEHQLGMTPDARAGARIAELEAALVGREEEQRRLYAIVTAWRAVHEELRAEAAALQKRQIEAQRAATRDRGALETHKDETRQLLAELAALRAKRAGATLEWPVVRSALHARN